MIFLGLCYSSKSDHLDLRRDFIHLLGGMEAPQQKIWTSFYQDCFPSSMLAVGSHGNSAEDGTR